MSDQKGKGGLRFGFPKKKTTMNATVTSITVGRTFNDGNYESTRIDFTCELQSGDIPEDVFMSVLDKILECRDDQLKQEKLK